MKNKKLLYAIGILLVAGLFVYSLFLLLNNASKTPAPTGSVSGPTLHIPTSKGDVVIHDITKNPVQEVANNIVVEKKDQYSIIYYPNDKSFAINILSEPVQQARDAAESAFLAKLGIQFGDACNLKVSTFVPLDVNANLAGQDFGLSFCPSGRSF